MSAGNLEGRTLRMLRGLDDLLMHIGTLACGVSWMDSAFRSLFPARVSSSPHDNDGFQDIDGDLNDVA